MGRQGQNAVIAGLVALLAVVVIGAMVVLDDRPSTTVDGSPQALVDAAAGPSVSALDDGVETAPALAVRVPSTAEDGDPAESTSPTSTSTLATPTSGGSITTTTAPAPAAGDDVDGTGSSITVGPGDGSSTSADPPTTASPQDPGSTDGSGGDPASSTTTGVPSTTGAAAPTVTSTPGSTTVPSPTELNAIEREIVRLTNELRTDPNGPLRRQGPVIACDGRVALDASGTGYQPISPLTVHVETSLQVSRPWSEQLTTELTHRPEAGVSALQGIGVQVVWAGENVGYNNYPDKAMEHFVGWRESDGHFCNMMDGRFTHIGAGEVTRADGLSFATQNFFTTG